MSLPRYPKYKDSGVKWLGQVPEHWEIKAIKHVVEMRSGEAITSESIAEEGNYPVFGGNGLRGYTTHFTHEGTFALVGRQGALCGNVNYASGKFWASEHAVVCSPRRPVATRWLGELLRALNLGQYSVAAAQPGLSVELVGRVQVPVPTSPEQSAIATFLEHETAKIDALVAEQERLIELLKEKRQAVISHAVTKGLNPDVPMKDSGNRWLGSVPSHWEVGRLKHVKAETKNAFVDGPFGSNLKSEHFIDGGDVYVIESSFATQGVLDEAELKTIALEHFETIRRSETRGGDIILAKIGAQFGKASVLPKLSKLAVVSGNSLKLTVNRNLCDVQFVNSYLMTLKTLGVIDDIVNGSAQPALSLGDMNNLPMLVPPPEEQAAIVRSLAVGLGELDSLSVQVRGAIDLLQERRTALISAAVTGQIDVREAAGMAT